MDYKASLKEWMNQHMLTRLDVRDILNQMARDDERVLASSKFVDQSDPLIIGSGDHNPQIEPDESMDGDFDSAMASAGHGTDEDYNGGCFQMEDFGWAGDSEICGE
jgi:hypothetical protein